MRIAIIGTSGVGKTFLETLLCSEHEFVQIPKYTDRPKRPTEESGKGIFFMNRSELEKNNKNYFFELNYAGFLYKWKKDDLEKNKSNNITIAITLESLQSLLDRDLNFIPIMLYTNIEDMDFLIERIKNQLQYSELTIE